MRKGNDMKAMGFLLTIALVSALSIAGSPRPAMADLLFCNQTSSDSYVQEGHRTPHDGLTVRGTMTVKKGTCGVIVPGRLAPHSYYLRIINNHHNYGSDTRLCVVDMADFTITAEDRPGFTCRGNIMGTGFHIAGFKNEPMYLASFVSIASYGSPTMIVTQRKDTSIHFLLK
jgi:uncharacterized membrane protein